MPDIAQAFCFWKIFHFPLVKINGSFSEALPFEVLLISIPFLLYSQNPLKKIFFWKEKDL
jgi:hypothetical protein